MEKLTSGVQLFETPCSVRSLEKSPTEQFCSAHRKLARSSGHFGKWRPKLNIRYSFP
ncbi:hypothetical protein TNCT_445551, partial [Trichonephila clavata]